MMDFNFDLSLGIDKILDMIYENRKLSKEARKIEEVSFKEHFLNCSVDRLKYLSKLYDDNEWIDDYECDYISTDLVIFDDVKIRLYDINEDDKIRINPNVYKTAKAYFEKYGRKRIE